MAGVLVVLSIALISVYFRESSGGGLHQVQSAGSTVLRPFEIAAERVARPFRDAYGYFAGLVDAKSENTKLRAEVDKLRQQAAQNVSAATDLRELQRLLHFKNSPAFPFGYDSVGARIIARPNPDLEQQVVIDAGKSSGIQVNDPVITEDGLVGDVTKVSHNVAQVTLLTDDTSNVSATDARTLAIGVVKQGQAGMTFDRVATGERVRAGDTLITAGWKWGDLSSKYPRGLPIGSVTSVSQNDVEPYKHIQLQPFANFKALSAVLVLIPRNR